jgi:hypothetical protein
VEARDHVEWKGFFEEAQTQSWVVEPKMMIMIRIEII